MTWRTLDILNAKRSLPLNISLAGLKIPQGERNVEPRFCLSRLHIRVRIGGHSQTSEVDLAETRGCPMVNQAPVEILHLLLHIHVRTQYARPLRLPALP